MLIDGILFVTFCGIVGLLIYKLFTFFDYLDRSFGELVVREGTIQILALVLFIISFNLLMLFASDYTYIVLLQIVKMIYGLLIAVQICAVILSYRNIIKPKK